MPPWILPHLQNNPLRTGGVGGALTIPSGLLLTLQDPWGPGALPSLS